MCCDGRARVLDAAGKMKSALWLLLGALVCAVAYPVSYSAPGRWDASTDPSRDCTSKFLCSSANRTWVAPGTRQFDHVSGCKALLDKGITRILFHGDSFMRQIYAGLLITLNGNYVNGSIADTAFARSTGSAECVYHKQFYEKKCGVRQLNHRGLVCDGKVLLDPILAGIDNLNHCSTHNGTVALFSFGNYKIGSAYRHGINNATVYSDFFKRTICPHVQARADAAAGSNAINPAAEKTCSLWWVSTHARLKAYFTDEEPQLIQSYNEGMRGFYDSRGCGPVNYIDVFNMTANLVTSSPRPEAEALSYDMVHWGMEVNLVKAQIILNALSQPW